MDVSQASPGLERSLSPDAIEPIPPPSPGSEFSGSLESMKDMTSQNGFAPEASPHPETPTVSAAHIRQNHVGTVLLHGVHIVSLVIDNKERLCLAQISNTLLKDFSYNEIHNRRVALGITCVQCTPVQLEILRRAGAMPISSRRCGMITKREAERLVKSFLDDTTPPKLPENFAFKVKHSCGWGCRGEFMPSRYNSSRAKCIKCTYCNMFFSPNKFIFHFHRNHDSKYHHPDAANFNSWRRHLKLDYDKNVDELEFAWEDVKAMFNGGSRKRLLTPSHSKGQSSPPEVSMKRSRSDLQEEGMSKLPSLSYPYPVMPMSNVSCANMAGYMARPPHPAFPFPTSEQQPSYPTPDNSKMNNNFADFWKNKNSPYCNPFGFLWAKNFGLLNDPVSLNHYRNVVDLSRPSSQKHSPSMEERMMVPEERRMNGHSREEGHWRTSKSPVMERKPETDSSYFSAFKPVSRDINLAFERRPTVSSSPLDEKELWSDRAQSVTSDNSGGGIESFGDPEETDINVTDIDQTELLKSTSEEVTDNKCVMVMQNSESETVISHTDKNKNNTRSQEEKKDANSKDESGKLSLVKDKSRPHEQASIEKVRRLEQFLFRFSKLRD